MENNQNHIEDIFRDAFANHEMEVSSKVWAGVQSGIAAQSAAGTAATSTVMFKAAAVIGLTSVIAIGTVNEINLQSDLGPQSEVVMIENEAPETNNEAVRVEATEWVATEEAQASSTPANNKETIQPTEVDEIETAVDIPVEALEEGDVASNELAHSASNNQPSSENNQSTKAKESVKESETNSKVEEPSKAQSAPQPKAKKEEVANTPQNLEEEVEEEAKVCSFELEHQAMGYISPDGDGTNECFSLQDAYQAENFHISIFTREGDLVFESNDPNFSWCGTDRFGKVLPSRTMCFYKIDAFDENDIPYTEKNAKGSIQIFR